MDQMITEGPVRENNTGWICPKCGTVISPSLATCPNCSEKPITLQVKGPNISTTWDTNNLKNDNEMIFS